MINYNSNRQLSIDEFRTPFRSGLDPQNRWVRMSQLIPWDELVAIYARSLSPDFGRPTLDARIEVGALIIQHILKLSDEELVEQIRENPYLQFFLGYSDYSYRQVFDPSLLVSIRKRLGVAAMQEMNNLVTDHIEKTTRKHKGKQRKTQKDDPPPGNPDSGPQEPVKKADDAQSGSEETAPTHRGKLLLDATVAPADIKYPTDLDLLNEARLHSERIIDILWEPGNGKIKPRTYRRKARSAYLSVVKKRKKSKRLLRKVIGKQLRYLNRNINTIEQMLDECLEIPFPLSFRDQRMLWIIKEICRQQLQMHNTGERRIDDRIVSLHQPHVRPIVRGKAAANVEFGPKLSVSLVDGNAYLDHIRWDAFNESIDLPSQVEAYRERFGAWPEVVITDQIYGSRANRDYLNSKGIRFSGKPLGRPPAKSDLNAATKKQRRKDNRQRSQIEGCFGLGKRKYGLGLVMTKTRITSETYIGAVFLAMNLVRALNKASFALHFYLSTASQRICSRLRMLDSPEEMLFRLRSIKSTPYGYHLPLVVSLI